MSEKRPAFAMHGVRKSLGAAALATVVGIASFAGRVASAQIVTVGDGGPGPVKAEHLTAELTTLSPQGRPQIGAGGTLQAGLVLTIEEHWHVYWKNAGDSGEPPRVTWTLPPGITAGPMQFPPPQRLPLGPLMDFGYEDQVGFPILLTASPTMKPGMVHLDAKVDWLVCSSQCLPGKAHLGMDVEVVAGSVTAPPLVGALGQAINSLPKPLPAGMTVSAVEDAKHILLTLNTGSAEEDAEFYPFDDGMLVYAAEQPVETQPQGIKIWLTRPDAAPSAQTPPSSPTIHGLVELSASEAYEFTVPVIMGVVPSPPVATKALEPLSSGAGPTAEMTALGAIGLALLGGVLLNLMPCVFPVLFLKGLALVHSSGEAKGRQRLHGLVYTAGIVVSFWAIVAVLLVLRAGGRQLGWGFQLQSPAFVAVLACLVFFLGLSLAGQFEFGLSLTSAGGGLAQKQGFAGSFFTGVLATVVATPCMGPLMGAAIGFALAQPAWVTFAVFTALAVGLALPYLILTMQPQWTSILPRPGAWMETLKQLTAVPLFATAIWLVWVYAQLSGAGSGDGIDRMAYLLAAFLVLAIAGWVLGKWPGRWKATAVAALVIAGALYLPLHKPATEKTVWQPYSEASFTAARATGKPVFIDFTAAWCLSCKVNEAAVLRSTEIDKALTKSDMQLLKADWTQYDPKITQMLASVGRSGVPTYVIYPPGNASNADVLPELLTKDLVLKAIEKDAKPLGQY